MSDKKSKDDESEQEEEEEEEENEIDLNQSQEEESEEEIIDLNEIEEVEENKQSVINKSPSPQKSRINESHYIPGEPIDLNTVNIDDVPKEDLVRKLLEKNPLFDSIRINEKQISNSQTKKMELKGKKTMYDVSSTIKKDKNKPNYLTTETMTMGETVYDFKTAMKRISKEVNQGIKDGKDPSLKLLITKKLLQKAEDLNCCDRQYIEEKVNAYIKRKEFKINKIKEDFNNNLSATTPFKPKTNNTQESLRKFDEFLTTQINHTKKIELTVKNMKDEKERNQNITAQPVIDKKSIKITEKKFDPSDPVYSRLYKQRQIPKKEEKINKTLIASEKQPTPERIRKLYNDEFVKQEKFKEIEIALESSQKYEIDSLSQSNKLILQRFIAQFKEEMSSLEKEKDSFKINLDNLYKLLIRMRFITKDTATLAKQESLNSCMMSSNDLLLNLNESQLKFTEKRLVKEIWDTLKDGSGGGINNQHLFLFLLSIVNLYPYYLLEINKKRLKSIELNEEKVKSEELKEKNENDNLPIEEDKQKIDCDKSENGKSKETKINFRKSSKLEDSKKEKKEKFTEKELNQMKLDKINNEIKSKIKIRKKYIGYDDENNVYITLEMADLIHKNFNFLSLNHSSSNITQKKVHLKPKIKRRPKTNKNSDKLNKRFRKKLMNQNPNFNIDVSLTSEFSQDYINLLLIQRKAKEKIFATKREEKKKEEVNQCSFKPKIEEYPMADPRNDRFDSLYRLGKNHQINRQNRSFEEIELEKNRKECTHKPKIKKHIPDLVSKSMNCYDQNSYQLYFERVKLGRVDRKIKDIIQSREPFQDLESLKEMMEQKEKRSKSKEISKENNSRMRATNESSRGVNESQSTNVKSLFDLEKEEKKEAIPLLVIDVNLREGEKRKIYVFDGDTAEGLAEKFSNDHNLEDEMRNKLKVLIQNHMSKLLMRIDEENHSITSEKSASNIF